MRLEHTVLMLCIRLGPAACHGRQGRPRFSLALMSRQTDEWDCLGTTSTLINQAPVLNYSMLLYPQGNGKGERGKDMTTRKKNKVKQRWKWMTRVESEEVRDCRGRRLPQGRGGSGVEIWRQVQIGWQDFMVGGAFMMFDRSYLYIILYIYIYFF